MNGMIWQSWRSEARITRPRRRAQRIARAYDISTRAVWDVVKAHRVARRHNRALRRCDIVIT